MKEGFTDYQILVLSIMAFMDGLCAFIVWRVSVMLIRSEYFRKAVAEAIQDTDGKFHWQDAKNVSYLVAGFLSALFTMNLVGVFVYAKMFDVGPAALVTLFVGVTFTLLGIAWKK